jgi:hypothetical protein
MAGSPRNRAKNYGQSGGGGNMLANLVGAYFGMPELSGGAMLGGEEMAAMGGPEAVIGAAEPAVEPLQVKKPGFWQNVLTKGAAGQNAAALDTQLKLGNYENTLQQEMLRRRILGQQQLEGLRAQNDTSLEETRFGNEKSLEELKAEKALKLAQEKAALDLGLPQYNQFDQMGSSPDYLTGWMKSQLSKFEKPALDNQKIQADILDSNTKRPTLAYMGVGNNAMVNPATGQSYVNVPPLFEEPLPGKEGGLKNLNVGAGQAGFVKTSGGINAEMSQPEGGGNSAFRGVPWSIAKPSLIPQLPNFAFPEPPKQALPPGYEPYRKHIEQTNAAPVAQENPPIIPQPATPMPGAMPIPGMSQQDKIMQWLRRPRPGFPSEFNPYTIR